MTDRTWNLTLTLPGEETRTVHANQSEMVGILRGLMRGEAPADADVAVTELHSADTLLRAA